MAIRIGMVSKFEENDGITIYTRSLAESLSKKGMEITTIGSKNSESDCKTNLKSLLLKKELERIVQKKRLQLLHIQHIAERSYYGIHTLNLNLIHALKQNVPVVVTLHELHYKPQGMHGAVVKKIEELIIRKANAIIVHTEGQKKFIEKEYKCKNAKAIHMGFPLNPMHKKKGKNILFFGMVSEQKGIEHLVRAMGLLEGYSLTIAGSIISKKYAEKIALEASKNKSIKTDFGWVPEEKKQSYMKKADIMALPYLSAPYQSAVLHDAASYGIPVVVTRTGPISEIAEEFACGEVVEPGNPEQLAEAIKKVEKSYSKYQKGMERYRKESSWEKAAEKHIELYEKLL